MRRPKSNLPALSTFFSHCNIRLGSLPVLPPFSSSWITAITTTRLFCLLFRLVHPLHKFIFLGRYWGSQWYRAIIRLYSKFILRMKGALDFLKVGMFLFPFRPLLVYFRLRTCYVAIQCRNGRIMRVNLRGIHSRILQCTLSLEAERQSGWFSPIWPQMLKNEAHLFVCK